MFLVVHYHTSGKYIDERRVKIHLAATTTVAVDALSATFILFGHTSNMPICKFSQLKIVFSMCLHQNDAQKGLQIGFEFCVNRRTPNESSKLSH